PLGTAATTTIVVTPPFLRAISSRQSIPAGSRVDKSHRCAAVSRRRLADRIYPGPSGPRQEAFLAKPRAEGEDRAPQPPPGWRRHSGGDGGPGLGPHRADGAARRR